MTNAPVLSLRFELRRSLFLQALMCISAFKMVFCSVCLSNVVDLDFGDRFVDFLMLSNLAFHRGLLPLFHREREGEVDTVQASCSATSQIKLAS